MRTAWFGHSCFRVETGNSRILIDPFMAGNPTFEKADIPLKNVFQGVTHMGPTHGQEEHVGDETVVLCHYGTLPVIDQTPDDF